MSNSGPHFTPDERCYYVVCGAVVWVSQHTGSSSGEQAPSVAEKFYSKGEAIQQSSSLPPKTPGPSGLKSRLTSGYPTTHFGAGQSQGSAPPAKSDHMDPYRKAMDPEKNLRGPPLNSPFMEDYNEYKDDDTAAKAAKQAYKDYLKTAPHISKKKKAANPGVYAGEPWATKDWHATASSYAYRAGKLYKVAWKSRDEMGKDYVGYDTKEGARKHAEHARILENDAAKYMKKLLI
ncbi:hypothetical protein BDV96DRAFT_638984 [Lophiotrema nucula]|uniref:Uncharacterized protein n=1 Tax=Lophiotrema nucula TaxID=690887 RepID=A0A6A5YEB3_9PLEO|nr:hypothetical protein BDV96DRAFT_638984 [Lophiotrema nucula]